MSACSLFEQKKEKQEDEVRKQLEGIDYDVSFDETIPTEILAIVKKASILKRLQKNPPLTLTALDKRAMKDVNEITEALNIQGYFDAEVDYTFERESTPPKILIKAEAGERYKVEGFDVEYLRSTPAQPIQLSELKMPLSVHDPVNLEKARDIAKSIAKFYRNRGYPFAKALNLKGKINRDKKTLTIIFLIDLGHETVFGTTVVEGNEKVSKEYLDNRFEWEQGKPFDERKFDDTRKTLIETGLFNEVMIQAEEDTAKDNKSQNAPRSTKVRVKLTEAPARSIGGGIKYGSSDGWSGKVFWRHNNILGGGQGFETKLEAGKRKNELRMDFSVPDFLMRNQTLLTSLSGIQEKTRAYKSKTLKGSAILSYDITEAWQLRYGIEGEIGRIKKNAINNSVRLFSIPLHADFDSTNNLLNPTSGIRLRLKSTPYFGHYQKNKGFWVNEGFASTYFSPEQKTIEAVDNVQVLALWGKVGHISAQNVDVIPPTKRFYSGGGNSVRGYGYQMLGPLDAKRTPIGGRSVIEFGSEYRFPVHDKFGVAAFIEGGSVSLQNMPKLNSQNLLFGAGLGVRYYTGIGPIRFDIAVPTKRRVDQDKRKKIDAPYQFYVSVGQAF